MFALLMVGSILFVNSIDAKCDCEYPLFCSDARCHMYEGSGLCQCTEGRGKKKRPLPKYDPCGCVHPCGCSPCTCVETSAKNGKPNEPNDIRPMSQWDHYLIAKAEAERDGKHLIVFVRVGDYDAARLSVQAPDNWICLGYKDKDFPECNKGIVVGRWNGSYLERIDLPATATVEEIKAALNPKKQGESVPVQRQWFQRTTNC